MRQNVLLNSLNFLEFGVGGGLSYDGTSTDTIIKANHF